MGVQWEERGRYFMMIFCEMFSCRPDIAYWCILAEGGTNGITLFFNLKESFTFKDRGTQIFGELWCMWIFFRWFEEWPFLLNWQRVFHRMKKFFWGESWFFWSGIWLFHIKGVEYFYVISCNFINLNFNSFFKLWWCCVNFKKKTIVGTDFIKAFIIWCDKGSEFLHLVAHFLSKLVIFFLECLGVLCEAKWHRCCI